YPGTVLDRTAKNRKYWSARVLKEDARSRHGRISSLENRVIPFAGGRSVQNQYAHPRSEGGCSVYSANEAKQHPCRCLHLIRHACWALFLHHFAVSPDRPALISRRQVQSPR